ncbi:MAG: hypothetical protein C5B50_02910 [Verrucomicrobia bacterium]|nr:MAG: hypothetical protein C5B50_02910 [Verrucomicrobiota bacterium]
MNLAKLHDHLIATARANPPSDAVPYAFETRMLARLRMRPALDHCGQWARALWLAVAPCVAIMALASSLSYFAPAGNGSGDLSQEFENTLLAAADQEQPAD